MQTSLSPGCDFDKKKNNTNTTFNVFAVPGEIVVPSFLNIFNVGTKDLVSVFLAMCSIST